MKEVIYIVTVLLIFILFSVGILAIISSYRKEKIRKRMKFFYGKRRDIECSNEVLSIIGEYTRMHKKMIDDITWNDLDMDDVFKQMNHTWSFAGEDYLYYLLHVPPTSEEDWKIRENLITYYQEHEEERLELQMIFAEIGKYHGSSVYQNIQQSIEYNAKAPLIHYGCLFLFIGSTIFTILNPVEGVGLLALCAIINIGLYFYNRKALNCSMQAIQYFLKLWNGAGKIIKKKQIPDQAYADRLKKDYSSLKKKLKKVSMPSAMPFEGGTIVELLDYITHLDTIFFYRCIKRLNQEMELVENLVTTMGCLESMIAIGSFRELLPFYCCPEFVDYGGVEVEQAYHPLLEFPVTNSIQASRGVLLTGSNASGKSTFLKTIAVNAILAQGVHTCSAACYRGQRYQILSSMALRDSLCQGESYYITEIKALKRVLDAGEKGQPVLCFVDEVLRGTNTVERIAASSQVLKMFCKEKILCFAATHDVELTYLLEPLFDNYHFQEQVIDGEVVFDYCLYEGRTNSRNAIRLLEMLGYEKEIIDGAEEMVIKFLKDGKWEMNCKNFT